MISVRFASVDVASPPFYLRGGGGGGRVRLHVSQKKNYLFERLVV